MFRTIRRFFRNLWRALEYSRLVFTTGDYDFDWFGLVKLMEFKISKMGKIFPEQKAKHSLKIAQQLLKRILKDDYGDMFWEYNPEKFKIADSGLVSMEGVFTPKLNLPQNFQFGREPASQANDLKYFCHIMNKYLLRWWD